MTSVAELVSRLISKCGGNAALAAQQLGSSAASLSRYRNGEAKPRMSIENRLRALVEGPGDLVQQAQQGQERTRLVQLESSIAGLLNALREEFHRTATLSRRQDVLDLVATLFFTHAALIDAGQGGLGNHLAQGEVTFADGLNAAMADALARRLPDMNGHGADRSRFFVPLTPADERFAQAVVAIFERDGGAFKTLHEAGRDDVVNEVFSRFMSSSFVDEKEMGQYLTPPEVTRFMVEVGFHTLAPQVRAQLLDAETCNQAGIILDPSCGVGSLLAASIRFFHEQVRKHDPQGAPGWLSKFVSCNVVGMDKSERMLRLARINLGLFGSPTASLYSANGLARTGPDGEVAMQFESQAQLILTNPPFGATYSGADITAFASGQNRNRVPSEILFLERYVDWAAPYGVIVSIVPDSVLVNRGAFARLRALLADRCSVEAVFSLPSVTFAAAGTSTKTSVLVLRRKEGCREG
jgi:type I restriction-modification system DNA methylase subunit